MPLRYKLNRERINADPRWLVLSKSERDKICQLVDDGRGVTAVKRFQTLTNCGLAEAKRAVDDVSLGYTFVAPVSTTLCPRCKTPLRTDEALQCFACGADWH